MVIILVDVYIKFRQVKQPSVDLVAPAPNRAKVVMGGWVLFH